MFHYEPDGPLRRFNLEAGVGVVELVGSLRGPAACRLMPRLHVKKITSIGVVEAGDNPEATILLFKSAPEMVKATDTSERRQARSTLRGLQIRIQRANPAMTLADAKAEAARLRPDLVKLLVAKVLKSQGTRIAEVEETAAAALRQIEDDERETTMTKTDAKTEVTRLAKQMRDAGEFDSMVEARAEVWRTNPDLVKQSRMETPATVRVPDVDEREQITEAVHKRGLEMSALPGEWNTPIPELFVRVWKSPDGQKLRTLQLALGKQKPATIRKSGEHAEAFAILKRWQTNPKEGLR